MQLVRFNAWTEIHGAPGWFLAYAARHLSIPLEPKPGGRPGDGRFGLVWWHEGQPYGSLVKGSTVAAGLTSHVAALARYYRLPYELRDARRRPEDRYPLHNVSARFRPYQDAVHAAIVREGCGVVDCPPRGGKTLMAARAIDALNLPTLYLAPSVQIVRQTYEVMCRHFGPDLVSRIDGSAAPHEKDPEKQIVVSTPQSALSQPVEWWATREVLIIDEYHHAAAETFHRINELAASTYYRLGFTGTHFRTGNDGLAMEAVCSEVLHRVPLSMLVDGGWIVRPETTFIPIGGYVRATDWRAAYAAGIVRYDARNEAIANLGNLLLEKGIPTVVITKRRAHADALGEMIRDSAVVKGGENALTSQAIRDFEAGNFGCLVGTGVIGEGLDVPRAAALIYAAAGSDGVTLMQSYFRPLTASPGKEIGRIYDFIDSQHPILRRHADRRYAMAADRLGEAGVVRISG